MVMTFKNCCCGCSLKTGSFIVGVLRGLGELVTFVTAMYIIGGCGEDDDLAPSQKKGACVLRHHMFDAGYPAWVKTTGFWVWIALMNCVHIIVCGVLLFGISLERPRWVKPWVIFTTLEAVVGFIVAMVIVGNVLAMGNVTTGIVDMVFLIVSLSIVAYYILVVNSYHKELVANSHTKAGYSKYPEKV